ncbi:phage/plasmid primase, P4 family [Psychroflexus sp. CAK1W]|uniref:DNA primase family protein n=1 Tax=Psychroflexus curvus TaxID=2873595 RepID=UPI001CCEFB14|nr:DNA primase family protein [Psychroflexus curvus]MBZ9627433.1 phage/plasmid primase, P4 family [Psychroflexus curvus]
MDRENKKNILPENSKVDLDSLVSEEVKFSGQSKTNSQILDKILDNLDPISFVTEAAVSEEKYIKQYEYKVIVVNTILKKSKDLEFDFRNFQDKLYVFNRCYWSELCIDELMIFLTEGAKITGIKKTKSQYFKFSEDLLKQFKTRTISVSSTETKKNLINLRNGTLEIDNKDLKLRAFDKEDFLLYQLDFDFAPEADSPIFQEFLDEVLPDQTLQKIISEYLGSIFINSNDIKFEKALFLYGGGSNGKSVIFEVIQALLGSINFSSYPVQDLTTNPNTRAKIKDKLLNFSSEAGEIGSFDIFKKLVSREPVDSRLLYKDVYEIKNYAKLMFNCNDLPKKNEYTNGYFRRYLIIPFEKTIAKKDQDKRLAQKIINNELSGVLNWIINGMLRLYANKEFTYSEKSQKASDEFELDSDSVKMFLQECQYEKSVDLMSLMDIFLNFKNYCLSNGYKVCSKITLSKRLKGLGYENIRQSAGMSFYIQKK